MDNHEIKRIALAQSAAEQNCTPADLEKEQNVITPFRFHPQFRKYYKEPISANLVSYGSNIVASVLPALEAVTAEYLQKYEYYHCFETPNLHWYNERLEALGHKVCFMAEFWLPNTERLAPLPCPYETRLLTAEDFAPLYLPKWSNALCEKRKELDVLGIGAYDKGELVGLAACSADGEEMWQIGVDVLPAYRRQGIASALTSRLALEILKRDKVPFYCCAWSNIPSARNAVKAGFSPAWVEITVKPTAVTDGMNE